MQTSERLRRYARKEIERLEVVRAQAASLPSGGRAVRLLCESLRREVRVGEDRLVKIVGLIGNTRAMELVQKSLSGAEAEARAAALEALETLGDKALAREIITLLEEEPKHSTAEAVLADILGNGRRWERALAIRSIQELGLDGLAGQVEELSQSPDPLIAETATEALARSNEAAPTSTLEAVSTLERVLLLRDIPIFSDLPPEDLQQIAAIARGQRFPKDTTIFHQEEQGDMMFVIVDGQVHVVRTVNGRDHVLAQLGPGDFVGEMAIIEFGAALGEPADTRRGACARDRRRGLQADPARMAGSVAGDAGQPVEEAAGDDRMSAAHSRAVSRGEGPTL